MLGLQKQGKYLFLATVLFLAVFLFYSYAQAHPGRTAADGCHYCRTNCDKWGVLWNQRHCHGGSISPPPVKTQQNNPVQNKQEISSMDNVVVQEIRDADKDYKLSHDGFREKLIERIQSSIGKNMELGKIGFYVYTLLPDIKEEEFSCDCGKTCPEMTSCAEAQYQLNVCGCTARDADHDGTACDQDCQ